jgi:tRNA dimethylallyltransferase
LSKERSRKQVVVIGGPTASGKSAAALALAREHPAVIINADAMQVYRDLRILTARPSDAEIALAPHRLYGVLDGDDPCTAGRWRRLALAEIEAAHAAGALPIVVGGSGLYLKALIDGIADIPPIADAIRAQGRALLISIGAQAFHAELARIDPVMAARLAPGDRQRLLRAWEVKTATGRSLQAFQAETRAPTDLRFASFVLAPPPAIADPAIAVRCAGMIASALEEVRALVVRDLPASRPIMKVVGVRELGRFLAGEIGRTTALDLFVSATRRYAKRQRTWFRHQMPGTHVFNEQFSESLIPEIYSIIREIS